MRERQVVRLSFLWLLLLGSVYVVYGRIHVDESYYFYAARLVYRGRMLYRDFFFLQNPGLPYVYGLALRLVPSPYVGRAVSLGFSLLALAACVGLARRLSNETGAAIAGVLLAFNSFHTYFVTMVRVYAAATALIVVGAYLYIRIENRARSALVAGLVFGLAVDFRMTAVPALGALVLGLALRGARREAMLAAAGGAAAVGAAFAPFVPSSAGKLWFQLVGFHSEIRVAGGTAELLLFKLRPFPRLANAYFLFWAAALVLLALVAAAGSHPWRRLFATLVEADSRESDLWLVAVATFVAHFAPMFVQASYFVLPMPLGMALVASAIARRVPSPLGRSATTALLLLGVLQTLAYGKSSLDPDGRLRGPFMRAAPYVEHLRSVTAPGDEIMTSDSQLVPFLADRDVLHGYESFEYFPSWSTEKCHEYGVVNDEILLAQLRQRLPAAVLINELSYRKPFPESVDWGPEARERILATLERDYRLSATFPNPFAPGLTSSVYVRR